MYALMAVQSEIDSRWLLLSVAYFQGIIKVRDGKIQIYTLKSFKYDLVYGILNKEPGYRMIL